MNQTGNKQTTPHELRHPIENENCDENQEFLITSHLQADKIHV